MIWEILWQYTKFQEIKVWSRLGRGKIKTLLAQTIMDKIFGTK